MLFRKRFRGVSALETPSLRPVFVIGYDTRMSAHKTTPLFSTHGP
jgi:hypothetical protein